MSAISYNPPAGEEVNLGTIQDVNLSVAPTDGQVLTYDNASSTWKAEDAPGGGSVEMNDLTDVLTSSEASGQMLVWDGTRWRNRTMGGDVTVGSTGLVTVQDDSHNHTEMDNSSGQTVLEATSIGVDVRDGSGSNPTVRLVSSTGAILGWIDVSPGAIRIVDGVTSAALFSDGTVILNNSGSERLRTLAGSSPGIRVTGDTIELTTRPSLTGSSTLGDVKQALEDIGLVTYTP